MNAFEKMLCRQFGEKQFAKIQKVKVGIAGLGGIGSNCAAHLVRSGFKNFKLIDFDKVEMSNLNRQFYFQDQIGLEKTKALTDNLKKINPDLQLQALSEMIDEANVLEFFSDCDIVIEAFDKAQSKAIIVRKLLSLNKLIVSVSGIAGFGNSDNICVHWPKKNLAIVGDLTSDVKNDHPFSPRVNIAAAKQADVVLEYVLTCL